MPVAPRLSPTLRSRSGTGFVRPAVRVWSGSRYHDHAYDRFGRWFWHSWWDPFHLHSHRHHYQYSSHWSLHCGGPFGFSLSLWYPWHCYRTWWWHDAYSTCWWRTWSQPYCAPTSYWWYPTTVYCPTYLYVPSTSVVVAEPAVAAEPAVVAAPAGEPVAAPEEPAAAGTEPATTEQILASKYVDLGDFYFRVERFAEAADAYARARSYAPDDASVHFVLADAAFATGDYHFAAFLIAEALRLDPTLASAEADKRSFYADAKRFDEHLAALERHLETDPYDASAHLVRGYNLRFSGRRADAEAAFRRVLSIAPEDRAAAAFLAAMTAGEDEKAPAPEKAAEKEPEKAR